MSHETAKIINIKHICFMDILYNIFVDREMKTEISMDQLFAYFWLKIYETKFFGYPVKDYYGDIFTIKLNENKSLIKSLLKKV
jgi:hypothetical protein